MKMKNDYWTNRTFNAAQRYWMNRVSKLACGKKVKVPEYATVRAYRDKNGRRRFAISGLDCFYLQAGGNLGLDTVRTDIGLNSSIA